jgi:hypothetical protein
MTYAALITFGPEVIGALPRTYVSDSRPNVLHKRGDHPSEGITFTRDLISNRFSSSERKSINSILLQGLIT